MLSENACSTPKRSTRNNQPADFFRNGSAVVHTAAEWNKYTTLGAGTAPFQLAELQDTAGLEESIPALRKAGFTLIPLGGGSNFAGSDEEMPGVLFLKPAAGPFRVLEELPDGIIHAGSAQTLRSVLQFALSAGYTGMAGISGIPGTCGGAAFMNAGANGVCISDFIVSLEVLDLHTGTCSIPGKEAFPWRYRDSGIGADRMVVSLFLRFPKGDMALETAAWETEKQRRLRAPKGRSAGSVFRNPVQGPAGRFLEENGAKGMQAGVFEVSAEHANWIVHCGPEPGETTDLCLLIREMKKRVLLGSSILLHTEMRFANMAEQENAGIKVLVLKGGVSSEREISLKSAANVADALREAGFSVREYDIQELALTPDMTGWADVVFPVLHGGYGEDGRLQELLESASIRFVGPSSTACRCIMDKKISKRLMLDNGLTTAAYVEITSADAPIPEGMALPLIVKPNSNGSTFGVTYVETAEQWNDALAEAFKYDDVVLVEEYIQGREGSVGIVAGQALPAMEVQYPGRIYDYDAKYNADSGCRHFCPPATMTEENQRDAAEAALAFAELAGVSQLVRVDFIVRDSDQKVYILEGNGLPGMTNTSMLPEEARVAGITMPELCTMLVRSAFER